MKTSWITSMLLAGSLTLPAMAQVGVYIGTPPPPIRYEEPGPPPGDGYVWVQGYWVPDGHHYRWVRGRWDRRPYEGAYWNHPHYDHYDRGWQYHEGHWDHERHENDWDREHYRGHDRDDHDDHDRH